MRLAAADTLAPVSSSFAGVVSLGRRIVSAAQTMERGLLPGYAVLVGAVLAPLAFGLASFVIRWPALGMPGYRPDIGIDLYSMHAAWAAWFAAIAFIVKADRPLALAVLLIGSMFVYRGGMIAPRHALMFAVGALLFHAVRHLPECGRLACRYVVAGLGVAQAAYMVGQAWGYDPLWFRFDGGTEGLVQTLGTIGTVDGASAYVAMVTPLMAPWLMPLGIGAVLLGKSGGATLALLCGLAFRFRHRVRVLHSALLVVTLFGIILYSVSFNSNETLPFNKAAQSVGSRLAVWELGTRAWLGSTTSPLVGWGVGGWDLVIPQIQAQYGLSPTRELWREAHNDLLQFLIEAGLIGFLFLAWWTWNHRAMFHSAWAGSVVALIVVSFTFFPWHVASTAFLGIVILGCATPSPAGGST